jgi:HEAT repeat protein
MDRPNGIGMKRLRQAFRSHRLFGVLVLTGLLGILWAMGGTTTAAIPTNARRIIGVMAAPARFNDLIRALDDPSPAVRLEAINCLATLNRREKEMIPPLRRRFEDPDPLVRVHAVRVAVRAGMPVQEAIPVAAQLLLPDRLDVCCTAAQILGAAGRAASDALPQLHACLGAPSLWIRLHAARAAILIDVADTAAVNVLRSARENEQPDARDFAAAAIDDVVTGLTRQLGRVDPEVRRTAAVRLEQLGTEAAAAIGALIGRLSDENLLVRAHAARAALRAGAPAQQIFEVAVELLIPERPDVMRVAASIIVELGPDAAEALPRLRECLNANSIAIRLFAAEATLRIDPNDIVALEALQSGLGQPESEIRFFAANALGAAVTETDEAVFALQYALTDSDAKVATAAALQLSRTNDVARRPLPDNLEPMNRDIAEWISALSNPSAAVRREAAIRLAIAGPAARNAVPALTNLLSDLDPHVRLDVAQALWEIERNGYPILPVLIDLLLSNRGDTRIGAAYILGRMGNAAVDTVPWLTKLLDDSQSFDQFLLAEAIVRLDPTRRSALDVLVSGLHGADADVRYLSTIALGTVPQSRQVAIERELRVAVSDRNFRVRCAACESLNQLQVRGNVSRAAKPAPLDAVIAAEATEIPSP